MKRTSRSPILVVDDSDEDLFLFRLLLKRIGATAPFIPMVSGNAVISWLDAILQPASSADRPFVCFLDIKMPQMGGFEVLECIRQRPALNKLPVVMLSSSDDERDLRRAIELGAQAYLTKYPSTATLSEVLARASVFVDAQGALPEAFDFPGNLLQAARRAFEAAP